jgi:methionyl-tRNA formyltransferase
MKRILVISDNLFLVEKFIVIYQAKGFSKDLITIAFSPKGSPLIEVQSIEGLIPIPLSVKTEYTQVIENYDLVFSIHCKQIFPSELAQKVRCINVHPGLNPHNRGWFPQVFSILNKLPLGATIHEIDEELDHGKIIAQKEVPVYANDTSLTAYNRVQEAEVALLEMHLDSIIGGEYESKPMFQKGNLNLKSDFNKLCELDLTKTQTIGETIDLFRALSHGAFKNAYFIDPVSHKKVFVNIHLEEEYHIK